MENDRTASYDIRTYIGTKTIQARRMNAADAKRAGANVPGIYFKVGHAEYNPGADGYLVIYDDGYRSWSPARVFEGSYKVADTHVDRLKIDLDELNERICMETRAINTFGVVSEEERWHLKKQLDAMREYADILYDRIRCVVEARSVVSSESPCCSAGTKEGGE